MTTRAAVRVRDHQRVRRMGDVEGPAHEHLDGGPAQPVPHPVEHPDGHAAVGDAQPRQSRRVDLVAKGTGEQHDVVAAARARRPAPSRGDGCTRRPRIAAAARAVVHDNSHVADEGNTEPRVRAGPARRSRRNSLRVKRLTHHGCTRDSVKCFRRPAARPAPAGGVRDENRGGRHGLRGSRDRGLLRGERQHGRLRGQGRAPRSARSGRGRDASSTSPGSRNSFGRNRAEKRLSFTTVLPRAVRGLGHRVHRRRHAGRRRRIRRTCST